MRKLAIITFVTLDGVMQGVGSPQEDPSGNFAHGGWATDYWPDVMAQVRQEAMAEPYDILFGRKTYAMFAANRRVAADRGPVDEMMDNATKYVLSSTLNTLTWENSICLTGDAVAEVSRLKEANGPLLQIHGSWQLIQALHTHELIDEYRLWTFPVVLGSGKRLFEPGASPRNLQLVKTAPCANGVVMSIWQRT